MTAQIRRGLLGLGQIVLQVVAALPPLGAGDLPLVGGDEGEGILHQFDGVLVAHAVADQKVEARPTPHGAHVDHLIRPPAVAGVGGEKMLDGVGGGGGEIVAAVGKLHADIVGDHVSVDAGDIHTLLQGVVVDGKAGYGLHGVSFLPWGDGSFYRIHYITSEDGCQEGSGTVVQ